jgi:hypothetical protein
MPDPGPTVSVVIPTYNRAALLPFTLDAILAQTCPPQEVIVVDDGSADDTPAALRRYEPAVRAIRIVNSGDLAARNVGLRAATCDLVAFCDSDDLWRPTHLETMLELWAAEPRLICGYADFQIVRDDQWQPASKFSAAPPGFWDGLRAIRPGLGVFDQPIVDRLIRFQPFFPSCLVVRRDAFLQAGGWDEAVSRIAVGDFATALRLAASAPFGVVDRPMVGIRKHGTNISGDVQVMNLGDSLVLEHVLKTRPELAPFAPEIKASVARRRREALDTAFARRDFAGVRAIGALLGPAGQSAGTRVKSAIAALPPPLGRIVAEVLLSVGSARALAIGGGPNAGRQAGQRTAGAAS